VFDNQDVSGPGVEGSQRGTSVNNACRRLCRWNVYDGVGVIKGQGALRKSIDKNASSPHVDNVGRDGRPWHPSVDEQVVDGLQFGDPVVIRDSDRPTTATTRGIEETVGKIGKSLRTELRTCVAQTRSTHRLATADSHVDKSNFFVGGRDGHRGQVEDSVHPYQTCAEEPRKLGEEKKTNTRKHLTS